MLRLPIVGLADGLHTQTLHPEAETIDLDPAVFDAIEVAVRLDVAGRRLLVSFDASAEATLTCDRTLVHYRHPVHGSHTLLFLPPEQYPDDANEDEVRLLPADLVEIDLTEAVRDTLMLALPTRRVAPEAEDAEIPTTFGAAVDDDGTLLDDRWDALRALRDDTPD